MIWSAACLCSSIVVGYLSPVYFAYSFLSKLGSRLLIRSDSYLVTSSGDEMQALLLKCKNHSAAITDAFGTVNTMGINHPGIYEDMDAVCYQLILRSVEPGVYQIHEYLLDDEHGCLQTQITKVNYPGYTPNDLIQYLKEITTPSQRFYQLSTEGSTLVLSTTLPANSIIFIEISRYRTNGISHWVRTPPIEITSTGEI